MITPEQVKTALDKLYVAMNDAAQNNSLPGFLDDRMLELEENDPGLYALLQHMLAQLGEDCNSDVAGHLMFVLTFSAHKAQTMER